MVDGTTTSGVAAGNGKAIILVVERDPHIRELEAHFLHEIEPSDELALGGLGDAGPVAFERERPRPPGGVADRSPADLVVPLTVQANPARER